MVTFSSDIDDTTIEDGDITITAPNGTTELTVTNVSVDATGASPVATFTFTPPGGTWNAADDGEYTVEINANAVTDGANPIPAGEIGTFTVDMDGAASTATVAASRGPTTLTPADGATSATIDVTYTGPPDRCHDD